MTALTEAYEWQANPAALARLPLSSLQRAYFLGRNPAFPLHCRSYYCVEFRASALEPARLEDALQLVAARHEALRLRLDREGSLEVLADLPMRLRVHVDESNSANDDFAVLNEVRASLEQPELRSDGWPLVEVRAVRLSHEWRLLFGFDLIIADGPAIDTLLRDLADLYDGNLPVGAASRAELTPAPLTRVNRARAYWLERLSNLELGPELPALWENVESTKVRFHRRQLSLDPSRWQVFKAQCEQERVSPASATLAAFLLVLARWSKRKHFSVSAMTDLRHSCALAGRVGNYSSTVIVRTPAVETRHFADWARAVLRELMTSLLHSDFPGIDVAHALRRQLESTPQVPFPVAFVAALEERPEPVTTLRLGMETSCVTWTALSTPQVLLDHQVMLRTDGSVQLYWDAIEECFPAGVIDDMWNAYCGLVLRLTENNAAWASAPSVPMPTVQIDARTEANRTSRPWSRELLHDGFWRQASERADALALRTPTESLTYSELAAVVTSLTRKLLDAGVQPGSLVAIYMAKGWEQVAAALAVLSLGAAYVPIDVQLPSERRNSLLSRCAVSVALCQRGSIASSKWPASVRRVDVSRATNLDATRPPLSISPDQLAYVIFTSGSTGEPKGVAVRHAAVTNTLRDINQRFDITATDRVFGVSSFSFDLSVYDTFGILAKGGTLVLPPAGPLDPESWLRQMSRDGVTVWNSVPAILQALVDRCEQSREPLCSSLRLAMLSGDWIPVDLPRRVLALNSGVRVASLGGATEASVWSIFHDVEPARAYQRSIPYGRALANQTMHVLDEDLEERPDWATGEIYIGGAGLADGYWQDPARTDAAFIVHPRTGERLYRTGDFGRWLGNEIEFLGREDLQVKIRGYRVELTEIEIALKRHPGVVSAVVVAPADAHKGRRLVAHIASTANSDISAKDLADHLRQLLPEYMVPTQFHFHEALPLTANGKVDRGSLVRSADASVSGVVKRREPGSLTEASVLRIWQDLLGHDGMGVDDDFFAVGGDSFLAVLMATRITDQTGARLPATSLLRLATVAGMASAIDEWRASQTHAAQPSAVVELQPGDGTPVYLIHPAGGEILCFRELASTLHGYAVNALPAPADRAAEETSIERIASRYLEVVSMHARTPFVLGGWSFGGVVAYEMSRQLGDQRRLRAPLLLIDTPAPLPRAALPDEAIWQWFVRDLAGSWCDGAALTADSVDELVAELRKHRDVAERDIEAQIVHTYATFQLNLKALANYTARPHAISMVQFRARQSTVPELQNHPASGDATWGWRSLATVPVEVVEIPGDHHSIMTRPNVQTLGDSIREVLESRLPQS